MDNDSEALNSSIQSDGELSIQNSEENLMGMNLEERLARRHAGKIRAA